MEKITNISLKHNRAKTILMVKDFLCLGTKEAVEYVNSVLETREIIIKPHNFHLSYLEIFNGDYIDESEKYDYYKIDERTQEALDWMESLGEGEKEKIRLLIIHLGVGPACG